MFITHFLFNKTSMKKAFLIILLISIMATGTLAKTLLNHDIIIDVSKKGAASVTERFVFGLEGDEIKQFEDISATRTNDLNSWHEFDTRINKYVVGNSSAVKISTTKISQGQFGYEIKLEYTVSEFAKEVKTQGRYEIYEINSSSFLLYHNGIFSLPKNTDLTISLDPSVTPKDILEITPTPWTTINKQSFKWISGTYTNIFVIRYQIETSISEGLTLSNILNFFIKKPEYGVSLLVIILLTITYRRQISELISESFTGEETIVLPKRKKD